MSTQLLAPAPAQHADPRRWRALTVMMAAAFVDMLDTTIVNVAIPSLQRDLDASYALVQWVAASYPLTFAVALITGGRLGDILGRRRMFQFGIAVFTVASALCGAAPTIELLIAARVAQGIGAAAMVPQLVSTIQISFPAAERKRALAMYGAAAGIASVLGPVVGGLLIEADIAGSAWRSIFLINVPIGIAALVGSIRWVRESKAEQPARLDVGGLVLVTIGLVALVLPLVQGRELGWPVWAFASLIASVVILAGFVYYEHRRAVAGRPAMVVLALFRRREFAAGMVPWFLSFASIACFFLVFMLYLQIGRGFSALHAGVTGMPFAVGVAVAAGVVPKLVDRYGTRVLFTGSVASGLGFGSLLVILRHVDSPDSLAFAPSLLIAGIGFGCAAIPLADLVLSGVPKGDAGSASGLFTTMQQLGGAVGVAIIGVVFFGALASGADRGAEAAVPALRAHASAAAVPQFRQCMRDIGAADDPNTTPASCEAVPGTPPRITTAMAEAGAVARERTFTDALDRSMWWVVGAFALSSLSLTLLPRRLATTSRPG